MRHRFISEGCKIFGLLLLLASGSAALRAQDQPGIKNIRTVVYEPLLKDTTWVTGKVVDYITFVKYDSKGRKMVENRLKPDGRGNVKGQTKLVEGQGIILRTRVRFPSGPS